MSTRQLFSPSRSGSSRENAVFQLQPPPSHRYKENRRCRVLSRRDDDPVKNLLQASLVHIKSPLSPRRTRRNSMSVPLLKEAGPPARDDDSSSDSNREELGLAADLEQLQGQLEPKNFGGIMTSPVKSDVRNSAFFGEPCVWSPQAMTGYESSGDKCMSASRTSSFHSIARSVTTFGIARKRRSGSLQSGKSPTERRKSFTRKASNEMAHTVLHMSPLSPLSLKTNPPLDTPVHLHSDHINTHLVLPLCEHEYEPLSATLKRLGAARKSMDLAEEEQESSVDRLYSHSSLAGWEQSLAERVAGHKQAVQANQQALQQAKGLFETSTVEHQTDFSKKPRYSWLNRDPQSTFTDKPGYSRIQSTARGRPKRNLRSSISSISTVLANHIFRRGQDRDELDGKAAIALTTIGETDLTRPDAAVSKAKGDGWGGLRPRSSWFPDLAFGPLTSPLLFSPKNLRPLQLVEQNCVADRDVWVDEVVVPDEEDNTATPEIEQRDESIRKLRVRFPSYLPKPSRDRHLSVASSNISSTNGGTTVRYTLTSAEGRPTSTKQSLQFMRINGGLVLAFLLVVSMAAFVAVIGTQAIRHASTANLPLQSSTLPTLSTNDSSSKMTLVQS